MRRLTGRLDKLERMLNPAGTPRKLWRVFVSGMDREANLANATCNRSLCDNGLLVELVRLDGTYDHLAEEELGEFIESFPIEDLRRRVTGWQT